MTRQTVILCAIVVVILLLGDELAYYYWRKINPGHLYTGIGGKFRMQFDPTDETGNSYPNGYRPAGGQ